MVGKPSGIDELVRLDSNGKNTLKCSFKEPYALLTAIDFSDGHYPAVFKARSGPQYARLNVREIARQPHDQPSPNEAKVKVSIFIRKRHLASLQKSRIFFQFFALEGLL